MIPVIPDNSNYIKEETFNSKTYRYSYKDKVVTGYCDKKDSVMQAIYFMLNSERYQFPIYSTNYGMELKDLIGMPRNLAESEIRRRIEDCLTQDDRITGVSDFRFQHKRNKTHVTFTVHTTFNEDLTYILGVDL